MDLSQTLFEALAKGNLPATRLILENSPERAQADLWIASFCGEAEVVERILRDDPEAHTRSHAELGWTALFCCAASRLHRLSESRGQGLIAVARLLIEAGAGFGGPEGTEGLPELALPEPAPFGVLDAAIALGDHPALVDLLVEKRAPVTPRTLAYAALLPRTHCLCSLLDSGAQVAETNVLHHQLRQEDPQGLRLLLEQDADPNHGRGELGTALHTAIREERSEETLHLLLRYSVQLDERDGQGLTAVQVATRQGLVDVADLLLSRGANPDATTFDRVLDFCHRGMPEVAMRLLSDSPELMEHVCDPQLESLGHAVFHGKPDAVSALLEVGFNPLCTYLGHGLLQIAAFQGNLTLLALLLDTELEVDARDEHWERPLEAAIRGLEESYGRDDDFSLCIQMLVEGGADPNGILHERSSLLAVELLRPHLAS